jgi:hypothetical protein
MRRPSNNEMQLTKGALGGVRMRARIVIVVPLAADLRVVSSERRNISAMIRAMCSGRPGWSGSGQATQDV